MCARVYAVVLERVRVESREWEVACTRPLGVAYVVATQMCDAGVLTVFFLLVVACVHGLMRLARVFVPVKRNVRFGFQSCRI